MSPVSFAEPNTESDAEPDAASGTESGAASDAEPGHVVPPHQRRWPASLAVLVVVALQFSSPRQVVRWPLIMVLELVLWPPTRHG
jgi:hypothetical protein